MRSIWVGVTKGVAKRRSRECGGGVVGCGIVAQSVGEILKL